MCGVSKWNKKWLGSDRHQFRLKIWVDDMSDPLKCVLSKLKQMARTSQRSWPKSLFDKPAWTYDAISNIFTQLISPLLRLCHSSFHTCHRIHEIGSRVHLELILGKLSILNDFWTFQKLDFLFSPTSLNLFEKFQQVIENSSENFEWKVLFITGKQ